MTLCVVGGEAMAQIADLNSAINKAGRQRMLSQRMAKAYFQIGQQVKVPIPFYESQFFRLTLSQHRIKQRDHNDSNQKKTYSHEH